MRTAVLLLSLVVWAVAPSSASSQAYPARPVKIIVPYGAGGPADVHSRFMAQKLSDALGQSFIVENRPGAGSVIGTDAAAKSPNDGYTLVAITNSHTTNETLVPKLPYQLLRDFVPVATLNYSDMVMVVHPSVAAKDLREFIALAKSKPGALNYASAGIGTGYHMGAELFKAMSGTDIVHVPYKSSSAARTDLIGGQVQMMIDAITTMVPNVQAGQARALATTGSKRSSVLPNVPTVAAAALPGYDAIIWLGFMAPTGTPDDILQTLNVAINKALQSDDLKAAWSKVGTEPMQMTRAEFGAYLRADVEKWAKIVKVSGAKLD
ncbi:MAG: tripartite tricarboxylate transporter substrate binding protein [Hyphomicrobiales bacterium]